MSSTSSYQLRDTLNAPDSKYLTHVDITPDGLYGVVGSYSNYCYVIKNTENILSIVQKI